VPDRSATASNSRRTTRTASTDNNAPAADSATPALVAVTAIVPGVPSGSRTIKQRTPPTVVRPSTARRAPASGCDDPVTSTSPGSGARKSRSLCSSSSKTAWTSPAPAGAYTAPKPSSNSERYAATTTSTTTGATTSNKSDSASTNPATPTTSSPGRLTNDVPPEEPHRVSRTLKEESCRRPLHKWSCARDGGLLALQCRPVGAGAKPPCAALAEDRRGERQGNGAALIASGGDQEDVPEASRCSGACAVEASKL
jgi:hypothetical protein